MQIKGKLHFLCSECYQEMFTILENNVTDGTTAWWYLSCQTNTPVLFCICCCHSVVIVCVCMCVYRYAYLALSKSQLQRQVSKYSVGYILSYLGSIGMR